MIPIFVDLSVSALYGDIVAIEKVQEGAWPDGDPKYVAGITLQTATRWQNIPDDDGRRTLRISFPGRLAMVLKEAVGAAGTDHLEIGGWLSVSLIGGDFRVLYRKPEPPLAVKPSFAHSPMEELFWDTFHEMAARSGPDGCYRSLFHRMTCQEPVGRYRIDFAFPDIKLAIEIDGHDGHKTREQRQSDYARERFLQTQGWQVVRFTGSDVSRDQTHCVADVVEFVLTRDAVLQREAKV